MSDGRVNNGGKRPGSGRPRKVVEAAEQSVLLELFNADAERDVVANMIALASMPSKQAVSAATWLWDRKYGKPRETIDQNITLEQVELTAKERKARIDELIARRGK